MGVFLSILNINSIITFDEMTKNRCGWWTGNKGLINVGLIIMSFKISCTSKELKNKPVLCLNQYILYALCGA